MPATQKRSRGRPALATAERRSNTLAVRAKDKLKEALERSAAENRRSLSEEAEARLENSFRDVDITVQTLERTYGVRTADLLLRAGKILRDGGAAGEAVTGNPPTLDGWLTNPVAYDIATRGLSQFVERLRPAGDRQLPRNPRLSPGAHDGRQDIAVALADGLADAWGREYGTAQKRAPARKRSTEVLEPEPV